jgi:serine/threonine protein kinase
MKLNDSMLNHLLHAVDAPDLSATPYTLIGEIGRGGMGTVYRVHDSRLDREIALKVFESGNASEARITAALEHPGIVPIHDVGALPDGRGYYTMRLVKGLPLHQYITEGTPLSTRIATFQKVCDAVAYAHSKGVIHRDLKPSNIMAGEFGEVAVLDWGVATNVDTKDHKRAGTPKFMAPEQEATPLADIYSMGVMLDSLLPNTAPPALRAIAAKAAAQDPRQRYASVPAIGAELTRYLEGFAVEAYKENAFERGLRFARRNKTLLFLIGAYFAVRIGVYFFSGH